MKILLRGGNIVDGTGAPAFVGDVLIEGEKILSVAPTIEQQADQVVDCFGLYVCPGFIDAHSHNDFYIDKNNPEKYFQPFIKQGITTQVTGNCGFSPFGVSAESAYKDNLGGALFHAGDAGSFRSFIEKFRDSLPVNIAPLIGHGSVRTGISGSAAEPLSNQQLEQMQAHVEEAMELGAIGGSLGLMYEPGIFAPHDELVAFSKQVAKHGGILTVHPRACSKIAMGYPLLFSKPHIEIALDEVVKIASEAGVKLHYSHLIHVGRATWKFSDKMLEKLHKLGITYDIYAFCHGASVITVILPAWYLGLPPEKRSSKFTLFKLKLIINITRKLLGMDFDDFTVADMGPEYTQYQGKNIAQLAQQSGVSKIDKYIELVNASNGTARLIIGSYNNEQIVGKLMEDELSMLMTDAWVEETGVQNSACFQCFPRFLIKAKELKLPVEKIVHKMTGKTAERFELPGRGELRPGYFADITVFDYDKLSVNPEVPDESPEGFRLVMINGKTVLEDGKYTPAPCGQFVLRKVGETGMPQASKEAVL